MVSKEGNLLILVTAPIPVGGSAKTEVADESSAKEAITARTDEHKMNFFIDILHCFLIEINFHYSSG